MNHQGSPSHTPPPQHTSKVSDQPDAPRQTLPAAETFIIVRPPPGKQNHPLNLQIQLILPSSQIQSQNRDQSRSSSIGTGDNAEPSQSAHAEPSQQASSSSSNTATGNLELTRTRSNRSTHSSRSNRSSLTFSSSKSETRNRRVTPLYNLVWHTVLPSLIVDAGTDAKIAKLLKRGIDIIDLASIEPNEIRASYAQDLEALISFEMSPSPTNGQFSLPSNGSNKNPSNNDRGPVTLINRIKRLGIFLKKGSNRSESGQSSENVARSTSSAAGGYGISSSLPQANGALSSVGPLAGSGRRAEGYVWIVRKWNKPEIVEWLAESSSGADQLGALLIEWRKDKKKSTRRPFSTSRPPLSEPQQSTGGIGDVQDQTPAILISSSATNSPIGPSQMSNEGETTNPGQREEQQQVSGMKNFLNRLSKSGIPNNRTEPIRLVTIDDQSRPASTDDSSNRTSQISQPPTMTEASQSRLDEESQDERNANNGVVDEDDAESDPEDSESKWHCEVVVQGKNMKTRSSVATLIPHPHHPKLVAQLNIPWNLEPIRLIDKKSNDGNDQALPQTEEDEDEMIRLSVEDVKDLVAVSCMWLIVKEELGGVGQRRKGDRGWSFIPHRENLMPVLRKDSH
ncbi:hypothetical protein BY996DRAFT_6425435 [Phakopsora pachyrhizi]|nr:hypothetical protein BY996DRAFT_6425435 [Phakopsora pachyrhizi]